MKAIKIAIVMILVFNGLFSLYGWMTRPDPQPAYQAQMQQEAEPPQAAEGLDLRALTALTKEIRSGQELERRLNEKGGINNLDLNSDGKVDYIFVSEFGEVASKIGYSLTVQPQKNESQEVAAITVEKNGDRAEIQVVGNAQIYGDQAIFNDSTTAERDQLPEQSAGSEQTQMVHSYFYPRPLWISPFFFGFYPSYFSFFPVMGRSTYVSHVNRTVNTGSVQRGASSYQRSSGRQISNPNKGKTASRGITRSLRNPTNTQKKFQATSRNRTLGSGGFGSNRSTGGSRVSGSSTGQSGSRLGASRSSSSSFGSSRTLRRSSPFSSGSVRSRSFGSRSFSFGK